MNSNASEPEKRGFRMEVMEDKHGYEPYEHALKENAATYRDSLIILLKAGFGIGILAMPRSFRNAGYAVGLVGTVMISILTTYAVHMVLNAEYELCKRKRVPHMSYPETVIAAFEYAPKGVQKYKKIAWFLCYILLLACVIGVSCSYLIFIAKNLEQEIEAVYKPIGIRLIIMCLLVPLLLISLIRNFKLLSPLSSIGHVFTMFCYVIICYYIFKDIPSISERKPVGTWTGISLFFGSVLFAMESIPCVLTVKNEMARPELFGSRFGVLNMSMVPITALFSIIGLFGYLRCGDETKDTITLNMPSKDFTGHAVRLLLAASVYVSFGIMSYIICDLVQPLLPRPESKDRPNKFFYEYVIRVSTVLIVFTFAMAIPNLEAFMTLLGSFSLANLGIFFPVIIETLTFWNQLEGPRFYLFFVKNLFLILVGISGSAIGVYSSLAEIVK